MKKCEGKEESEGSRIGHLTGVNEIGDDVFFETDLGLVFVARGSSENEKAPYAVSVEGDAGQRHYKARDEKGGAVEIDEDVESLYLGCFEKTDTEKLWHNIAEDFNESFARHLNLRIKV